jgi:hypothetical protein
MSWCGNIFNIDKDVLGAAFKDLHAIPVFTVPLNRVPINFGPLERYHGVQIQAVLVYCAGSSCTCIRTAP